MATKSLGRVSIVPQGDYDENQAYKRLDLVKEDGKTYLSLKEDNTDVLSDEDSWMLLTESGKFEDLTPQELETLLQPLNASIESANNAAEAANEAAENALTGISGEATQSNSPELTGFHRYIVTTPITSGSAWGIEVTQAELDDNWVFFNVKDGVITKDSKPQQGGKSAYQLAVEAGFSGTEIEWLESLNGADGADGNDIRLNDTEQALDDNFTAAATPTYVDGKFIDNNGVISNNPPYRYAEFIKRTKRFSVTSTMTGTPNFYAIHYYNKQGAWIGRDELTKSPNVMTNKVFTAPDEAHIIRINTNLAGTVALNFNKILLAGLSHVNEVDTRLQNQIDSLVSFIFDQNNVAPQYIDVYNAVEDKPGVADALKQSVLVDQLVDTGIWSKIKLFALLSTGKQSLVNWKNPAQKFTVVGDPIFTPYKGFTFSPGNYIDTGYNPATTGNPASFSFVVASSEGYSSDKGFLAGVRGNDGALILVKPWMNNDSYEIFSNKSTSNISPNFSRPLNGFNGSKGYFGYLQNGSTAYRIAHKSLPLSSNETKTSLPSNNIIIGGFKDGSTAIIGTCTCSFLMVGEGISVLEYNTLVDVLEEYQRSVNNPLYPVATAIVSSKQKLNIKTYLTNPDSDFPNNSETIHPSVVYFKNKIFGYNWWQANTPYPAGDGNYEIPEVYVSEDGVNWLPSNPENTPIFPFDGTHPYSDVCLRHDPINNEFVLFFRYTGNAATGNQFAYITSPDGRNWNTSVIHTALAMTAIVPVVVHDGGQYRMYVQAPDHVYGSKIQYATSPTLKGEYTGLVDVVFPTPYTGINHYDVIRYKGKYYITLARGGEMFIMVSNDGVNFNLHSQPGYIAKTQDWEIEKASQRYYRPCFVEENDNLWVYYSVSSDKVDMANYTGRQRIIL